MPERREAALLSLSDTTGAVELAAALAERGYEIVATSGTKAFLEQRGICAEDVESLTKTPPLFGGRVKTMHPAVFGGILFDRDSPEDVAQARERGMPPISVVAVTLYPPPEIDIGGVALLRAAAKNHAHVSALSDPSQYESFIAQLRHGGPSPEERRALAIAAFSLTARYDEANAARLSGCVDLRYGENPHQRATFTPGNISMPEQLAGKALSYNNILDLDAALRMLAENRAVVVKHTIPCGVAERPAVREALALALDADRTSAYGGIVAVGAPLTVGAAALLSGVFVEIVAAPEYDGAALALLQKKKTLRVMRFAPELPRRLVRERVLRSALGGVLSQAPGEEVPDEELRVVSKRAPTDAELRDLRFAWDVVRHVKSNGIVLARDLVTSGICAGQTNRVSAVQIAVARAGERARGAACASDGFFPFKDGLEAAAAGGCSAVIAPGGSIRDAEVIAAAEAAGIALVFSSYRHFLH